MELLRPWKLATLAIGIAVLIAGSIYTPAPDWGIADSILLAVFTYLTAPTVARWVFDRRYWLWPVGVYLIWLGSIGLYRMWWMRVDPSALALMGDSAHVVNVCMYIACGLFWAPRAPIRTASWLRP